MSAKRLTREQLEATIIDLRTCNDLARMELKAAQQGGLDLRKKLDDVKERLAFAEAELQRAGGYILRVQEDDVVREPLVETGDPEGEKRLVPKRKPTHFAAMSLASDAQRTHHDMMGFAATERSAKHRHWVTY